VFRSIPIELHGLQFQPKILEKRVLYNRKYASDGGVFVDLRKMS